MDKAEVCFELDEINEAVLDWTKLKNSTLNNKDAAVLLGDNPWRTKEEMLAEKKGFISFSPEKGSDEATRMQEKMEQQGRVKEEVNKRYSIDVTEGAVYRNTDNPNLIATVRYQTKDDEPLIITSVTHNNARFWDDAVPVHFVDEAQWDMMVTGAKKSYVCCLVENQDKNARQDIRLYSIARDEKKIEKLIDLAEKFQKKIDRTVLRIPVSSNRVQHKMNTLGYFVTLPKNNPLDMDKVHINERCVGQERDFDGRKVRYLNLPMYNSKGETYLIGQMNGKPLTSGQIYCALYNVKGRMLETNNRRKFKKCTVSHNNSNDYTM